MDVVLIGIIHICLHLSTSKNIFSVHYFGWNCSVRGQFPTQGTFLWWNWIQQGMYLWVQKAHVTVCAVHVIWFCAHVECDWDDNGMKKCRQLLGFHEVKAYERRIQWVWEVVIEVGKMRQKVVIQFISYLAMKWCTLLWLQMVKHEQI